MDATSAIDRALQRAKIRDDCFGEVRFLDDSEDDMRDPIILSPIEQLPQELVWKIIEYEPDAVFNLKLTSRILNGRVNEFALERETIQLVESLVITVLNVPTNTYERKNEIIKLGVPKNKSNLFELRLNLRNIEKKIQRTSLNESQYQYQMTINSSRAADQPLMNCLRSSMGRRIGNVHFNWRRMGNGELPEAYTYLNGIAFDSLEVQVIASELLSCLPAVVTDHKVRHVSLHVGEFNDCDTGAFLVQLSSLVRSIHLHQQPVYRARRSNYLFGVTNGDWGRIVFDMYAKNIDTLCIDNAMFPEYLSKDAADSLMKELPLIGKKIWFKATCNKYDEPFSYRIDDHFVQVESSQTDGSSLMIRHLSREHELFH